MKKFIFIFVIFMCLGMQSSTQEINEYRPKKNVVVLRITDYDGSVILQKEI